MSIVRRPGIITLRASVIDNVGWAANPVTGLDVRVGIRRLSDDYKWRWGPEEWQEMAGFTGDFEEMVDKGDGSYEKDWDQTQADGGVDREYNVMYWIYTVGAYFARHDQEHLIVQADPDDITFIFTVDDGSNPLAGAEISIRLSAGGRNIRKITTVSDGTAVIALPAGTYYAISTLRKYTHTEESFIVSSVSKTKTLSMTAVTI